MTNVDKPYGFRPEKMAGGQDPPRVTYYELASDNAEIGKGAPLILLATGLVTPCDGSDVNHAGIAAQHIAANIGGQVAVWDDPFMRWIVQFGSVADTESETYSQAVVGSLVAIDGFTIQAESGLSQVYVKDIATAASGGDNCFKILGKSNIEGNEAGINTKIIVQYVFPLTVHGLVTGI